MDRSKHMVGTIDRPDALALESPNDHALLRLRRITPAMCTEEAEKVNSIRVEEGADLVIAYAIPGPERDVVWNVVLRRSPKFERLLSAHDRGVVVTDERLTHDDRRDLATRILVGGTRTTIETRHRVYLLDLSEAERNEAENATRVLRAMYRYGDLELVIR